MIFINKVMADNLINMWGLVSRVILVFFAFALTSNICHAKNDVAIITDTMLTKENGIADLNCTCDGQSGTIDG